MSSFRTLFVIPKGTFCDPWQFTILWSQEMIFYPVSHPSLLDHSSLESSASVLFWLLLIYASCFLQPPWAILRLNHSYQPGIPEKGGAYPEESLQVPHGRKALALSKEEWATSVAPRDSGEPQSFRFPFKHPHPMFQGPRLSSAGCWS